MYLKLDIFVLLNLASKCFTTDKNICFERRCKEALSKEGLCDSMPGVYIIIISHMLFDHSPLGV